MNFSSEKERQDWIINHASYFTVVRLRNRRYERHERKTLAQAEELARSLCLEECSRWMIYAIADTGGAEIDTWVKTVSS